MKQLDPRAIWLFFFQSFLIWFSILFFFGVYLALVIGGIAVVQAPLFSWINLIILFGILLFVAIPTYIWARLSYHYYRYELTDNGFKKELGVIRKKYVTIPYQRIQNVDVERGILARLLGLSDLKIQTAGMGVLSAEGKLPGLSREEAENLRSELIRRISPNTGQGL